MQWVYDSMIDERQNQHMYNTCIYIISTLGVKNTHSRNTGGRAWADYIVTIALLAWYGRPIWLFHTDVVAYCWTTTVPLSQLAHSIYIMWLCIYLPVFIDNLHGRQQTVLHLDSCSSCTWTTYFSNIIPHAGHCHGQCGGHSGSPKVKVIHDQQQDFFLV